MSTRLNWNAIGSIVSGIGLILTSFGLFYTAKQIELSRQIARSDFKREFYNSIQQYNDIHLKLSKNGEWRPPRSNGPSSEEEWFRLQRYMGLLEQIDDWYSDGIINLSDMDGSYSHRIKAIYSHPTIRDQLLVAESFRWKQFLHLVSMLEKQPVYSQVAF